MSKVKEKSFKANAYEEKRLKNIQANNIKLKSLNVKRIAASMVSPAESRKDKKRIAVDKDQDYEPVSSDDEGRLEKESEKNKRLGAKTKQKYVARDGRKKSQFIPPLSLTHFLKLNDKERRKLIGDDALRSVSSAMKVVEEAICSQEHVDVDQDNMASDDDITNEEFCQFMTDMERENQDDIFNDDEGHQMEQVSEEIPRDENGENGSASENDDDSDHEVECHLNGSENIDTELITTGKAKNKRGAVYCRKLTALAPGEKFSVEFNADGIAIGENGSMFAFFIGEQVRNRAVCPIQVSGWDAYSAKTLDHLWSCILEKWEFDEPALRKEDIMQHARSLFRNSRYKLRQKYIIKPNLTNKEAQLKNKPKNMLKADWKFLIDLWHSPEFQKKSVKGKKSRSSQKMPHYTGTKSHARVKEELMKKTGRECTRVDVLLETRKRKSKKAVDSTNLACNMKAIDEVNKLKKERDEGLHQKTDEQILTEVLGKDTRGYLRCYGRGKTITQFHGVKPSRMDLAAEVLQVKKTTEDIVEEAKKEVEKAREEIENARKEAEEARKDADAAKKEAEATRNEVDAKIYANNKVCEERIVELLKSYGIVPPSS